MSATLSAEELSKSSSDQTGEFPITSSVDTNTSFLFYHYDTNTINGIAIKVATQQTYGKNGKQLMSYSKPTLKHQIYTFSTTNVPET